MDRMQEFVRFIFDEVWCEAVPGMNYVVETLFAAEPDLLNMITELDTQEVSGADNFLKPLHALFEKFKGLNQEQKQQFKDWFALNNDIQRLCEHGDQCQPGTYEVIKQAFPEEHFPGLVTELKRFYKNLYSADFLKLASVKSKIGVIDDHNHKFVTLNHRDVCPFCGLSGMLNRYENKREAYDHYFPKDKYPFNSINFYNLVPACHHCNSSYKLAKDPHIDTKDPLNIPRKVFYPFRDNQNSIELQVTVKQADWENLERDDIELMLGPDVVADELKTWNDLYGIADRYKAECCSTGSGKAWLTEVFERADKLKMSRQHYVETIELDSDLDPYVDKRFLKKAFLAGCRDAKLFD